MPTLFSYKNDDDVDERANPVTHGRGQEEFNDEARGILDDEGLNSPSAELNQLEQGGAGAPAIENPNRSEKAQDQLNNGENQGAGTGHRFTPELTSTKKRFSKILGFVKKRGAVIVAAGTGGSLVVILASVFSFGTMAVNLAENATEGNDASSPTMGRFSRILFGGMMSDNSDLCGASLTVRCKASGKMSYKLIDRLSAKGVIGLDDNNNPIKSGQSGYPDKNPSSYSIDMGDGKSPRIVSSSDMPSFISENPKIGHKIYGRFSGAAINMRFHAWTGKYLNKKFFSKLLLKKTGGLGKNSSSTDNDTSKAKETSAQDRIKNQKESIPKTESSANSIGDKTSSKLSKVANKAGKGGAAYSVAVGTCVAVKLPAMIGAAAAAVQLAQLLPLVQDTILSVGFMEKASGLGSGFTEEGAQAVGDFLTTQVKNEDGVLKAPIDSSILLGAVTANTGKLSIPEKLAPGYAILTNPVTKAANTASKNTEEECSVLMSPYTMYTVMAAQVAAGFSGIGTIPTIINLAGGLLASKAVELIVASEPFTNIIAWAATELLTNDSITEAIEKGGEDLGDALGLGLIAFFSLANSSRHFPGGKESNISDLSALIEEEEEFNRQLDIAALSPFDTSSKYTFLGSIVYNMSSVMISNGYYNNSIGSVLNSVLKFPSIALSMVTSPASAATNYTENFCSFGDEWGQGAGEDTPAITVAGTPCSFFTDEQLNMPIIEALDLLSAEGWINEDIEASGDIDDLIQQGYIVKDSPIIDYIEDCSDPSSGDYLYNSASCTVDDGSSFIEPPIDTSEVEGAAEQTTTVNTELKDSRSIAAISVFLVYYQVMQAMNGEDENIPGEDDTTSTGGGVTGEVDPNGWASPVQAGNVVTSPYGYRNGPFNGYEFHDGVDLSGSNGPIFAVRDGTVTGILVAPGGGWGNAVSIDHGEVAGVGHIYSFYAHLASVNVSVGDTVKAGQQIGVMGTTGNSTGVHLHFGIYKIQPGDSDKNGSTTYNPAEVLPSLIGGG